MRKTLKRFALAGAVLVAGYTGETMMGDIYRAGVLDEFAYAGGGRDLETVIVGNPFDAPKDEVDRAITDAMRNHHPGPSTNFTTRPDDSARPNYRITIVFNPPDNLSVHDLCGDVSGVRSEEPGASLRLVSIFCSHGDVMSYVYASTRAASTPRDPAVASVVANMMRELIPPVDPHATGANDLPI